MIRVFDDDEIVHVEGNVDPIRDIQIINDELRLKDLDFVQKVYKEIESKCVRSGNKDLLPEFETLKKVLHTLQEEKRWVRYADWTEKEVDILNKHLLLTCKPVIYLLNMSESEYIKRKNKWLVKIKTWVDANDPGATVIPYSAAFELKVQEIGATDEDARKKFLEECGCPSVMDKIIVAGYKALNLAYFFTVGADEVKAWTIHVGAKAPQAAGRIHTDFEKGFIMAEVMKYEDLHELKNEADVKAAGKYRQQGKLYTVEDGDIILFKFNAGAGLSDKKK
jgi:obg-like ATPase 1